MTDQRKAYLYTAVVILSWSTVATVFKLALETLDPLHLLAYSSLIATLVIWIFAISTGRLSSIRETPNKILFGSIFLGLLNPFIFYIVLFAAYDLLPDTADRREHVLYFENNHLAPDRSVFLRLARRLGIGNTENMVDGVRQAVAGWRGKFKEFGIADKTIKQIEPGISKRVSALV